MLFLGTWGTLFAQTDPAKTEAFGIAHLTEYLGLRPTDFGFRSDYTDPDSLRLKQVARLMRTPLGMPEYTESLRRTYVKGQPEVAAQLLFADLEWEHTKGRSRPYQADMADMRSKWTLYFTNSEINQLLMRAATYLDVSFPRSAEMTFAPLSAEERRFLHTDVKEMLMTHEAEEQMNPAQLDSIEKYDEHTAELLADLAPKIDRDPIVGVGIEALRELMQEINLFRDQIKSGKISPEKIIKDALFLPDNTDLKSYLGKQPGWAVGGVGNDRFSGDLSFVLDLGGDDVYDLTYDPAKPHGVIIIDLGGNDVYQSNSDFGIASGCLSVGMLLDFGGDDIYRAKSFSLGSGFFGFGVLYDAAGNDQYFGDTHIQGAATFGLGLLIDENGRDQYTAAFCSQGFGATGGIGALYDINGVDLYSAGGKYKDFLRYKDHYLSMSQGFGYGIRPTLSGGIGALIDFHGNDTYLSDIFGQGTSYWWSLGVLYDSTGNDIYTSYQYAQGAATHMTLGMLLDESGDDAYTGKGVMQGCGHDYACGLLFDRGGNDTYVAYDLSQGAGSANGAGMLLDISGDDRYLVKSRDNTQGYGNPRRDYGSIGLFIDLGGKDYYDGNGRDSFYWMTKSKWGGGMDIEFPVKQDSVRAETE